MSELMQLNEQSFIKEVLESDIPVLVDFWAAGCQPCLLMVPELEALAEEMKGKIKFAKLDVGNPAHQQLAMDYRVQSIPNMQLFKEGKVIKEFIGLRSREILREEIEGMAGIDLKDI